MHQTYQLSIVVCVCVCVCVGYVEILFNTISLRDVVKLKVINTKRYQCALYQRLFHIDNQLFADVLNFQVSGWKGS